MSALLSSAFSLLFSSFISPAPIPDTRTENGALAYSTTFSANLDFFGSICRGEETLTPEIVERINTLLPLMWAESPLITVKNILYKRDARKGAGEKAIFLTCYKWLFTHHPETAYKNLSHIPFYGYWKDLLNLLDDSGDAYSLAHNTLIADIFSSQLIQDQLEIVACLKEDRPVKISIAAKWTPSLNCSYDRKFGICHLIAHQLGYGKVWQRTYRQNLSYMRSHLNIVEKSMCSSQWSQINLDTVPSIAMNRYKTTLEANIPIEYKAWIDQLKRGEAKVNTKMLMPHQLVTPNQLAHELTQLQWDSLRENTRTKGSLAGIIPICDFSGSMKGIPMDVAMALGVLISELAEEPFKDLVIGFSSSPQFYNFRIPSGHSFHEGSSKAHSLAAKVRHAQKSQACQGLNTDIIKCFTLLLEKCIDNKLTQEQIPKKIILLTDMAFDAQTRNSDSTAFHTIRKMYTEKGYTAPVFVFWNLRGTINPAQPVSQHETGSILISGWSPNLLESILDGTDISTPLSTMQSVLNSARYARLTV